MLQKLPVNNFEWIKNTSQFNEDFIKTIMKKVMKNIFLKLIFNILKDFMNFIMIYHFCQERIKLKKSNSLWLIYMIKLNILYAEIQNKH